MALKSAYLTGILAHVPEAERGKAETELQALEDGGLRQNDYSRLAAEAKAEKDRFDQLYQSNLAWLEERKEGLQELDTLRAKVADLEKRPATGAVELPKDVITEKVLGDRIDVLERQALGAITEFNTLSLQHYQNFGEVLDLNRLMSDKRVQQIGLRGVYQDLYKDQIKAKTDAAQAARDEAIREEGRKAERERLAGAQHPYPVSGNEPSALDAIEAARGGKQVTVTSVDDMAANYSRLSSERAGAGAGR
jgi:hypothetical protein